MQEAFSLVLCRCLDLIACGIMVLIRKQVHMGIFFLLGSVLAVCMMLSISMLAS